MNESEKQKRADARKKRKRRQMFIGRMIIVILLLIILGLCAFLGKDMLEKKKLRDNREQAATSAESESTADTAGTESAAETETRAQKKEDDIMSQAELKAAQYDYDGAIELLKASSDFADSQDMQDKVAEYEQAKSELVEYPLDQVTHVFYHTLIYDTSKAFDGDSKEAGYNQVMTTIDEFNKITQSMYDKGYVMVSLHDMCTVNEDGTVSPGKIMLPPGKKAFVLSQDDVSYYHYMDGDGMATIPSVKHCCALSFFSQFKMHITNIYNIKISFWDIKMARGRDFVPPGLSELLDFLHFSIVLLSRRYPYPFRRRSLSGYPQCGPEAGPSFS